MNDKDGGADKTVELVTGWLETAFPERRCPKCNHKKFFIVDPTGMLPSGPLTFEPWPIAKIACARCGFVEEHLTGLLKSTLEREGLREIVREADSE